MGSVAAPLVVALCGHRLGVGDLQSVEVIDSALRVCSGLEDSALVILQNLEPMPDIGGVVVAWLRGDTQIGTKESGAQFSDQLFAGVAFITEALAAEVTVKAALMFGPVN